MTELTPSLSSIQSSVQLLNIKLAALEQSRPTKSAPSLRGPDPSFDPFASKMLVLATATGFTNTLFTRCPPDYYSWRLETRRTFLQAPTQHHLTKSIVMENTRHTTQKFTSNDTISTSKYLCCVFPYTVKIDSDRLRDAVRKRALERGDHAPAAKAINYRLAADCVGVTGYEPNAVTPLGMKTHMPVVVAEQVAELVPQVFWLGGGEVSLKWRVQRHEFVRAFGPVVLDFAISGEEG